MNNSPAPGKGGTCASLALSGVIGVTRQRVPLAEKFTIVNAYLREGGTCAAATNDKRCLASLSVETDRPRSFVYRALAGFGILDATQRDFSHQPA